VYLFRKTAPLTYRAESAEADIAQYKALDTVWKRWTETSEGYNASGYQSFADTDSFEEKVEACLRQWLAERGVVPKGLVWDRTTKGSPFCGLAPFEASHAAVYFGREFAIARATRKLRQAPFLLLIGASGVGKSSLLRAGLLPHIVEPGIIPDIDAWRTAIIMPSGDPVANLAEALCQEQALGAELAEVQLDTPQRLADVLAADGEGTMAPIRQALDRVMTRRATEQRYAAPRPARLLVGIDQLERVFAEAQHDRIVLFAGILRALVEQKLAMVVATLRGNTYGNFQEIEGFVALRELGAILDLQPPSNQELDDIVARPVAACMPPLAFEIDANGRSLDHVLVADAKGGNALPLLQMTLDRLYQAEATRGDGVLRFADYPGMDRAVTQTAAQAFASLDESARNALPGLITAFIHDVNPDPVTGELAVAIRPLVRREFEHNRPGRAALVDAFIAQRLLTAEDVDGNVIVRPVHEALLRAWPEAVRIIAETQTLIRSRRTLEPRVAAWASAEPADKPGHLVRSPALLEGARSLLQRMADDIPAAMTDYIMESLAADQRRRETDQRRQSRILTATAAMSARSSRLYVPLIALLLLAVTAVHVVDPSFMQTLRLLVFDQYQRLAPAPYDPELQVRVVTIDAESLSKHGQWPWPRTIMSNLLQALVDKGALAVAFDIQFDEPDRMSLEEIFKSQPPERQEVLAELIQKGMTNDKVFADTIKQSRTVTAVTLSDDTDETMKTKSGFSYAGDNPLRFVPDFKGVSRYLHIIHDGAAGTGATNTIPDRDQIVRHAELMFKAGDTLFPSFVAEALRVAQNEGDYLFKSSNASDQTAFGQATGINSIKIGSFIIPTDSQGGITIKFRHTNPGAFIPAWKVLDGTVEDDEIANRIILVGVNAHGLGDVWPTPVDTAVPGVEIHAQVIEHILAGRELTRPDYILGVELGVVLILGGILAIVLPARRPRSFAIICLIVLAAILAGGWASYQYLGVLFDPVYAILAAGCVIAFIIFFVYQHMNVQRDEIRDIFTRS
jgi:CHASE2 domain-containing sensor protein